MYIVETSIGSNSNVQVHLSVENLIHYCVHLITKRCTGLLLHIILIQYLTKFSVLFDFHHVCSSWTVLESLWCGICDSKIWNIGTLMFLYGCFMRAHQPFLSMHHMLSNCVNIKAISSSQSRLLFLFSLFFCWLCFIAPTYMPASLINWNIIVAHDFAFLASLLNLSRIKKIASLWHYLLHSVYSFLIWNNSCK